MCSRGIGITLPYALLRTRKIIIFLGKKGIPFSIRNGPVVKALRSLHEMVVLLIFSTRLHAEATACMISCNFVGLSIGGLGLGFCWELRMLLGIPVYSI